MEIKIRELCKSYGKKKALQNFDATFENGVWTIKVQAAETYILTAAR